MSSAPTSGSPRPPRIRWAVLGAADIAIRRLIPAFQQADHCEVVALASRSRERAEAIASELHIPHAYGSYAEAVQAPDVDAVYIPLPNTLHAEWTIRAAEAGKHVLCEKPMATTVADCDAMLAACQQHGVQFMEAFMYRFHPQHAFVRSLLADGVIGQPTLLRASFCVRMQRPPDDIRFDPRLGGGALFDVGVYAIDAARWLAGQTPRHSVDASAVSGLLSRSDRGIDVDATASLRFPHHLTAAMTNDAPRQPMAAAQEPGDSGQPDAGGTNQAAGDGQPRDLLAAITTSFQSNGGGTYELIGEGGKITVHQAFGQPPGSPARVTWDSPDGLQERRFLTDENQYVQMVEAFSHSLLNRTPPPFEPSIGRGNIAIIETLLSNAHA